MRLAHDLGQSHASSMEEWFIRHMPPDDDLVDLIEWAFLDGQIDGIALNLAQTVLMTQTRQSLAQMPH